jgi:integrase
MQGQIIPRGDHKWMVRVFTGRDGNGKRQYHNHTVHGAKKDAQKYLNGVLRSRDLGTFVEPARTTLDAYLNRWLETAAKQKVSARTHRDYTWMFEKYVRPALGARRLDRITPLDIQGLYGTMQERGLSARTVRYTHNTLSSALKQAIRWRMLSQNPAALVQLPKQIRREMRAFSPEEADRFRRAAEADHWGVFFVFALASGTRPSEALGLRWEDVDFEAGAIVIRRKLERLGKEWSLEETKTAGSRRTIPLPSGVTRALVELRRRQAEERLRAGADYADHGLVFATPMGQPLDKHNLVHRHFKPILAAAGLPKELRLYDLRHSCATLLLAAGENAKVVGERLGHAGIALTLDTYAHVLPTMQRQAAERLEAILFGGA